MSMGLQAQKTQTWRWKRLYLRVFDQESVKDTLLLSTFLMMSNINKILVWNCRGAASSSFYRNCKNCLDIHHPEILAIMETHISPLKLQQSFQLMGFDGFNYSENRGFAGGIIVVWKSNKVDVEEASLVQTWDEFQNGERWIIGDGTQVSLWNDVWLAKQTRLVDIINNIPNNALAWKVQQLVGENGEWNMTLIESLLPSHLISNFSSVLPPHVENGEDTRTWGCNKAVTFTIASAYKLLRGFNENGATTVWKLICSLEVPERVGCFAWQVAHETVLHVLRDCRVASFVWRYLIPATLWSVFFGGDMAQWVQFNMVQARHDGRKSWPKTWATACYMLWRWRNREVHDAEYSRPTNTPVIIRRAVADYDMGLRSQNPEHYREMQRRMVQWQRPAEGWICINTDGAAKERGKIAGSGRVMRDHNGIWLCSFSRFIGEATAFDAELWGIFDGLTIARRQGYQHVELQIHSHNVVSCLTNNMERNGLCILVRRIRSIMQENWRVVIKHVYREANKIADGLASLACVTKVSLSLYEQPPTEVAQVYHDDLIGVSTPRLVVL
ncbi:unnamed protein product [Trifolium pratense]|uniref:Uncharacterized protein n=1 Tax=Trifolium pratense TaxID=57577 RepID=A0ACB0JV79_TRIPR|nr:unnamed protein product [Trifolium pratense]